MTARSVGENFFSHSTIDCSKIFSTKYITSYPSNLLSRDFKFCTTFSILFGVTNFTKLLNPSILTIGSSLPFGYLILISDNTFIIVSAFGFSLINVLISSL